MNNVNNIQPSFKSEFSCTNNKTLIDAKAKMPFISLKKNTFSMTDIIPIHDPSNIKAINISDSYSTYNISRNKFNSLKSNPFNTIINNKKKNLKSKSYKNIINRHKIFSNSNISLDSSKNFQGKKITLMNYYKNNIKINKKNKILSQNKFNSVYTTSLMSSDCESTFGEKQIKFVKKIDLELYDILNNGNNRKTQYIFNSRNKNFSKSKLLESLVNSLSDIKCNSTMNNFKSIDENYGIFTNHYNHILKNEKSKLKQLFLEKTLDTITRKASYSNQKNTLISDENIYNLLIGEKKNLEKELSKFFGSNCEIKNFAKFFMDITGNKQIIPLINTAKKTNKRNKKINSRQLSTFQTQNKETEINKIISRKNNDIIFKKGNERQSNMRNLTLALLEQSKKKYGMKTFGNKDLKDLKSEIDNLGLKINNDFNEKKKNDNIADKKDDNINIKNNDSIINKNINQDTKKNSVYIIENKNNINEIESKNIINIDEESVSNENESHDINDIYDNNLKQKTLENTKKNNSKDKKIKINLWKNSISKNYLFQSNYAQTNVSKQEENIEKCSKEATNNLKKNKKNIKISKSTKNIQKKVKLKEAKFIITDKKIVFDEKISDDNNIDLQLVEKKPKNMTNVDSKEKAKSMNKNINHIKCNKDNLSSKKLDNHLDNSSIKKPKRSNTSHYTVFKLNRPIKIDTLQTKEKIKNKSTKKTIIQARKKIQPTISNKLFHVGYTSSIPKLKLFTNLGLNKRRRRKIISETEKNDNSDDDINIKKDYSFGKNEKEKYSIKNLKIIEEDVENLDISDLSSSSINDDEKYSTKMTKEEKIKHILKRKNKVLRFLQFLVLSKLDGLLMKDSLSKLLLDKDFRKGVESLKKQIMKGRKMNSIIKYECEYISDYEIIDYIFNSFSDSNSVYYQQKFNEIYKKKNAEKYFNKGKLIFLIDEMEERKNIRRKSLKAKSIIEREKEKEKENWKQKIFLRFLKRNKTVRSNKKERIKNDKEGKLNYDLFNNIDDIKEEEKKRILEKELGLISEFKYQISNTDNKELKEKLQNLLDQIEELKRKDIQLYIKTIKDNYEHYIGEIHELIEAKNMEERIRKFVGNLTYERSLINSQREILKNTIYIKDNTFHSSMESFSKNKFKGKK